MKNKSIKYSLGALSIMASIATPIATVVSCGGNDDAALTAKGSSTVLPFMLAFAKKYDDIEVQVAGGGSGAGQKAIIDGSVDFGNMSATPDSKEIIGSEKFRTVTVGIDGLSIVIKGKKTSKANISDILSIFTESKGSAKWLASAKNIFGSDASLSNVEVLSRENPDKSGTAEIFGIGLGKLSGTDQNKISHHPKNSELNGVTNTTSEANSEAFNTLKGTNKKYGITYLSLGVADSLIKKATANNEGEFSKVTLTDSKGHEMIPLSANVGKTYNWARPLNVIYNASADNKNDLIKFVESMLKPEGQAVLPSVGYLKLTKEQLKAEGITSINDKEMLESNKINGQNGLKIDIKW
ncbi:PstS family phosphate ABC transporter substrate-binding protein [Mycoplasma marinum]|uniref:PBP domain-containing protein n=1 Tax=Mycoplasma marinum TaxID=1937190 RepID=A0A4R0XM29_9MOLU|nr:substrate-binding domain-containing protein [Mycoplasma marinum]TCG11746.1 hypothetical protein C4B24_01175 [Mycoplasma marinum]